MHKRDRKNKRRNKNDNVDSILDKYIKENKKTTKTSNGTSMHDDCKHESDNLRKLEHQQQKTADELVKMAEEMWKTLKEHVKNNPDFVNKDDKQKLEYFRENLNYRDFMTEYPITTRYMICMGQYSSKAFRRMLDKIKSVQHPPADKREKGYMEDQWVRRQADYIRYLWESYQKHHYDHAEAAMVWEDAYTKLKGEFDDFRNKHKESETIVKEEKEKFKADNAKDLFLRLKSGTQSLDERESVALYEALKDKLYAKRHSNTLKELLQKRQQIAPMSEGVGVGLPEPVVDKDKPTVRMIETVDASRLAEIPKELLVDQNMLSKLPGGRSELLQAIQEADESGVYEYEQDGDIPVE